MHAKNAYLMHANKQSDYHVSLEHKTSHKGQFFEIEIYASSES